MQSVTSKTVRSQAHIKPDISGTHSSMTGTSKTKLSENAEKVHLKQAHIKCIYIFYGQNNPPKS